MKVLMFGWEFPPFASGGLGTACFGLTKGLVNQGVELTFVVPHLPEDVKSHVKLVSASDKRIKIKKISSILTPYMSSDEYSQMLKTVKSKGTSMYGSDLFHEVYLYSKRAAELAEEEEFDVIHAHDWMTYQAGIKAKKISKKPLVLHIHATEFDRTGGNPNQYVYDIEREGFHKADKIVAVSNYTKNMVVKHYGISPDKVAVAHNAVEFTDFPEEYSKIDNEKKTVLFLGRITLQKGPEYFLYAAKKVLEKEPNVNFVIVGTGDMYPRMINLATDLGISKNVLFTGFLSGPDIDRAYRMADLYVLPSVSEPFGITPLEAMRNNIPVIISRQSGVSEVLSHALKVDFWDIDEMANKMLSVLNYSALSEILKEHGSEEVRKFDWNIPAKKCIDVYKEVLG